MPISVSTMDKKIYAVIAVVIIVIAAVGAYIVINKDSDDESGSTISAIARVNTDGSGIYLKAEYDPADFYTENADGSIELIPSAWGGKVWGTPGTSSIQHVQMMQMAEEMGLGWAKYNGGSLDSNTMYYVDSISNYDAAVEKNSEILDGGILWEPQYTMIASNPIYQEFLLTNDLFPGHTCCIIGAQHSYISSHQDETVRFLAAYVESVREMKNAIANHVAGEYDELMQIAIANVTMPLDMTQEQKIAAIESAFSIVNYTYADSDTAADPLDKLTSDMAALAEDFYESGQVSKTPQELGFDSYSDMASALVLGEYMHDALNYEKQDSYQTANITVAVLSGDIHQLAIHYGMAKGIFADYGISITLSNQSAGPAAFTAMANGAAQFAFLGAPPMTTNTINGGYISP